MPTLHDTPEKMAPWNDPTIEWVCEDHPTKEFEHKMGFFRRCGGAGMPKDKSNDQ